MNPENENEDYPDIGFDTPPHKNILVIKLSALGDFIQALGPMAAIRRHHPDAAITLLTTKSFTGLGLTCGYFDHVITDIKPKWNNFRGWWNLRKKLNETHYDRVYDLQNNDRTSIYFRLFKAKNKPEWVGTAFGASHRNASPDRTAGNALNGHIQTLAQAGIKDVMVDDMRWAEGNIERFKLKNPYVLLVPGAAENRPEKKWPAQHYAALATHLSKKSLHPVIIGTQQETDIAQIIRSSCPDCIDLTGQTAVTDIILLARNAAGAIGNDTGPMHLIAPTSCPSYILFSRHSDPKRHAPVGKNVFPVQTKSLKDFSVESLIEKIDFNLFS